MMFDFLQGSDIFVQKNQKCCVKTLSLDHFFSLLFDDYDGTRICFLAAIDLC